MKQLVAAILLAFLLSLPVAAQPDAQALYEEQLAASGAGELTERLPENVQALLKELEGEGLTPSAYTGLSLDRVLHLLAGLLREEQGGVMGAFGMLLGVVLISALFSMLEGTAHSLPLRQTYHAVAALAAGGVLLVPLFSLMERVGETVEQVTVFLTGFAPVYAGILMTSGSAAGGMAYQTTLLGAAQLFTWLIRGVVFPVLTVSLALGCTGSVTAGFCLDRFSQTLHKAILWMLGLFSTLFSGVLSLQQMVAAAGDSLSGRVVRFSLSSFVPVVGGLLGEAYSTVVGCSGLLRSTVGCFGLVATVLIVAAPLVGCVCWSVSLSLAGSGAALFGLAPLETLCRTAAGVVRVMIALLAMFALLMVISTTVVVFAGRGQ